MPVNIERAVAPDEIIVALAKCGVESRDVAAILHTNEQAVSDWACSRRVVSDEDCDRLVEIRNLVILLKSTLSNRGVRQWLRARNHVLDDLRPLEVLASDGYGDVDAAARAFVEGTYL